MDLINFVQIIQNMLQSTVEYHAVIASHFLKELCGWWGGESLPKSTKSKIDKFYKITNWVKKKNILLHS